ncbi:MAG: M50 family metallopeptidase [Candidatus Coproplasma sp.]
MANNLLSNGVWTTIWSVLAAILILLAMITIHEFGHYVAGKALKFKINEFAIGFGPKLFKHTSEKSGELFTIRAIPLGGYCAFEGEDEEGESDEAFNKKAPWKRIIVLIAGAAMNYILALTIIIISFFAFGQASYRVNSVEPSELYPVEYSLAEGDVIVGAEGRKVYAVTDLMSAMKNKNQGDKLNLSVIRGGERQDIEIYLRSDSDFKNSSQVSKVWRALGAGTYEQDDGKYWDISSVNCTFGFWETLGRSFGYSFSIAGTIFKVLGELLTGNLGLSAIGGPVTTIKLTSEIAAQGVQSFLQIAAYIGVNLAVFNLLPIPALDGSKVVFCLIEWIFKKPVPRKVEAAIHAVGFALILGFAVLVDILQFI